MRERTLRFLKYVELETYFLEHPVDLLDLREEIPPIFSRLRTIFRESILLLLAGSCLFGKPSRAQLREGAIGFGHRNLPSHSAVKLLSVAPS